MGQPPFRKRRERLKREEIDRRVCEDAEAYNQRFGDVVRDFTSSVRHPIPLIYCFVIGYCKLSEENCTPS